MSAEPKLPSPGDLIDNGKYRIDSRIGEGGMGVVFAATHMRLDKRRAIKWLLPKLASDANAVRRFLAEAKIAARVEHTNVVSPIDISEDTGAPYIVMELLEGETLADFLGDDRLDLEKAGRIFMPILQGVAAAHDQQIVHRDLKPGNIFLARWGGSGRIPKILDFGIAKLLDGRQTQATLTDHGALLGTIQYMSPEQLKDVSSVGPQTDVYALGVILYRMVCGKLPFEGNLLDLALRIREGRPTPLSQHVPNLPPGFEAAVLRSLSPSQSERFADVRSFAQALSPFFPHHGIDFSPQLRKSEPSPISDLPPALTRPAAVERPAKSAAAQAEVSTFHPVTNAPKAPPARPWRLAVIAGGAVALAAIVAVIAWPADPEPGSPAEVPQSTQTSAAAPGPEAPVAPPLAASDEGADQDQAAARPQAADQAAKPDAGAPPGVATGWDDLGGVQQGNAPAPDAPPATGTVAPPVAKVRPAGPHKAGSDRAQPPPRSRPTTTQQPQQQPAKTGSPLDTILEHDDSKRLDKILEM